jgi:hypothetical protein
MTFDANQPNAAQSPGIFPVGANTNWTRLKTLVNAEHVFNDTAAPNDGTHRQVTLVNRVDPTVVPDGTNSMVFGKAAGDGVNELWFYDSITPRQLNWRQISGEVSISPAYVVIAAIPPNCYGDIYLFKGSPVPAGERGNIIQVGAFVSGDEVVNGYSYGEKFISGSSASQILRLGFAGDGENGLNLRVRNDNTSGASQYNGTWKYRIFFRQIG